MPDKFREVKGCSRNIFTFRKNLPLSIFPFVAKPPFPFPSRTKRPLIMKFAKGISAHCSKREEEKNYELEPFSHKSRQKKRKRKKERDMHTGLNFLPFSIGNIIAFSFLLSNRYPISPMEKGHDTS